MKLLFLGGAGEMAVAMLPLMRDDKAVKHVTIADINEGRAQAVADEYGEKFSAAAVDAGDHNALVEAMKPHDAVVNYVGPFYRFEKPCAEAAIEAGVHYISISDDYDAYLSVRTLEEKAKKAGVKILTGFGNSPGLTQILARKGYNSMDNPQDIAINWGAGSNEAVGPANILHVMHLMNGTTIQWQNGVHVAVRAGEGRKMVEFSEPIGRIPVFYTGHAESVSIPQNLPGLRNVSLHGGCVPTWIFPFAAHMSTIGLTKTHERRLRLQKALNPFMSVFSSDKDPDKSVGRVEVRGTHKGEPTSRYYTYVGHIADITSIPCFVATKWLLAGKFDKKPGGVYSAERLLDNPDLFLRELKRRSVEIEYHE